MFKRIILAFASSLLMCGLAFAQTTTTTSTTTSTSASTSATLMTLQGITTAFGTAVVGDLTSSSTMTPLVGAMPTSTPLAGASVLSTPIVGATPTSTPLVGTASPFAFGGGFINTGNTFDMFGSPVTAVPTAGSTAVGVNPFTGSTSTSSSFISPVLPFAPAGASATAMPVVGTASVPTTTLSGTAGTAAGATAVFINPEAMANPTEFDLFSLFGSLSRLNPFAMFFGTPITPATTQAQHSR
jgi:hypothetical protein